MVESLVTGVCYCLIILVCVLELLGFKLGAEIAILVIIIMLGLSSVVLLIAILYLKYKEKKGG